MDCLLLGCECLYGSAFRLCGVSCTCLLCDSPGKHPHTVLCAPCCSCMCVVVAVWIHLLLLFLSLIYLYCVRALDQRGKSFGSTGKG